MADGKAAFRWTDETKMVFLVHLFDSGAATIDWSKATLPPGKRVAAVKMMMRRLADSYRPQLDKLKSGEIGEADSAELAKACPEEAASKGEASAEDAEAEVKSEGEQHGDDDKEDDDEKEDEASERDRKQTRDQ
ncbi:uncharacterized protein BKCO1_8000230 [Diplodia corticola]|uniref:Uncharacterized protein n=1 Tax=Diplodia corticola TaxID=236234 RepID=A0A1J9R984_9PEZI|nr:uncharacterized protein BKCO1_8000230 [Diplodia corticola]OJD37112.1 hypothetical protein BKCO1_8000230 [Diplodia corticola]